VIALDAKNGVELWRIQVSSEVLAKPALSGNLVLIRTVDGKLTALDIDNGRQVWGVQQSVPRLSVRGTAAPVVTNSLVISGFDNGRLAAYDLSDGGQVWNLLLDPPQGRTEIERLADLNATVQAVGNDLYAVGYQGRLASIAIESGQLLWSREMSSYAGLAADFNNLYISGQHSQLVAVARRSGRELWQKDVLHNRDITGPAAFGSSVVVGDFEGYLHWFDPTTGELQTRVRAGSDRITTAPLVVSDTLYVVTDGGKLIAFRGVAPKRES
jgi:outer membrane protein assembly factor BamB